MVHERPPSRRTGSRALRAPARRPNADERAGSDHEDRYNPACTRIDDDELIGMHEILEASPRRLNTHDTGRQGRKMHGRWHGHSDRNIETDAGDPRRAMIVDHTIADLGLLLRGQ